MKLEKIANIYSGTGFPKNLQGQKKGSYPFYKVGDISRNVQNGNIKLLTCDNYINDKDLNSLNATLIPKNSVVFAKIGEALKLNRRALTTQKCLVDNNAIGIKADTEIVLDKYLFYFLNSFDLDTLSRATTVPSVRKTDISKIDVPVPLLLTQHRIVKKIDELFSDLDNGIDNLQKAKQQLEAYKQSVLKAAFEGKLTATWREKQDHLPKLEELREQIEKERKYYREQQLKEWRQEVKEWEEAGEPGRKPWKPRKSKELDTINEVELKQFDKIPNYWGVEKLGNLFSVHVGSTPKRKKHKYWDGEINWVSSGEVGFRRIKKTEEKITQLGLENSSTDVHPVGTVMLGMIGQGKTRGQAAILDIPACHNQNTAAIRVPELDYSPELLFYFFYYNYQKTRQIGSGNNQKALNKNRVRNIAYLVIPLEEQKVIVQKIELRFSIIDQLNQTINEELNRAKNLRQSILKKAFEGKLIKG